MPVTRSIHKLARLGLPLALVATIALSGCGSDDDSADDQTVDQTVDQTTDPSIDPSTDPSTDPVEAGAEVEVRAVDFSFTGLPRELEPGTRIRFVNDAETEVHELVAIKLPEDETRSAQELMALPPEESEALLGGGEPSLVVLATPGGEEIHAVGDGVLREPGRYLVMCSVPVGSDASLLEEDAPELDGDPHFAHGMYAEVLVG